MACDFCESGKAMYELGKVLGSYAGFTGKPVSLRYCPVCGERMSITNMYDSIMRSLGFGEGGPHKQETVEIDGETLIVERDSAKLRIEEVEKKVSTPLDLGLGKEDIDISREMEWLGVKKKNPVREHSEYITGKVIDFMEAKKRLEEDY